MTNEDMIALARRRGRVLYQGRPVTLIGWDSRITHPTARILFPSGSKLRVPGVAVTPLTDREACKANHPSRGAA